jgi:endonuclease/exonuclease/phosphatase family metal-dependent hydrolase
MKYLIKSYFVLLILLSVSKLSEAQTKQYEVACLGFYNLENLFDTINDPDISLNFEFSPESDKHYNTYKYFKHLDNLADVISRIGTELTPAGVTILGVAEVENRSVLEDLVKREAIKDRDYQIVHYDSPDFRGIDVALLYQGNAFEVTNSKVYLYNNPLDTSYTSRDQLLVSGILDGEEIHIIVNHWPSRRGGQKASEPKRIAAAEVTRHIVDSLLQKDENAKIVIMGDLNDDPVDKSVYNTLRAKGKIKKMKEGDLFNPMYNLYKKGIGSLAYRDNWNLFDNIIITQALLREDMGFHFFKAKVFNKRFMKNQSGRYKGYPKRAFVGSSFLGGYSDHFPTYIYLIKEI